MRAVGGQCPRRDPGFAPATNRFAPRYVEPAPFSWWSVLLLKCFKRTEGMTGAVRTETSILSVRTIIIRRIEMRKLAVWCLSAAALVALSGPAMAADAEKGNAAFTAKCALCHQIGPNAQNLVGPQLNGVAGRKAAGVADYAMYSAGMK